MSVAKTACYTDSAYYALSRVAPPDFAKDPFMLSLLDFELGDPGNFAVPGGFVKGNARAQVLRDDADPVPLGDFTHKRPQLFRPFAKRFAGREVTYFGLRAVYKFIAKYERTFFNEEKLSKSEEEFVSHHYYFGSIAGCRSPANSQERTSEAIAAIETNTARLRKVLKALYSIPARSSKIYKQTFGRTPQDDCDKLPYFKLSAYFPNTKIYYYQGCYVFKHTPTNKSYFFTRDDIERLEGTIRGFSQAGLYFATYYPQSVDRGLRDALVGKFLGLRGLMIRTFKTVKKGDEGLVCRAFDVSYNTYLATIASDINRVSYDLQVAKYEREGLTRILDMNEHHSYVEGMKMKETLELLLLHKCLPPPDFDLFGQSKRQLDMYDWKAPSGNQAETPKTGPWADLIKYIKWTIIRAYYERHKICPGNAIGAFASTDLGMRYPHIRPGDLDFRDVHDIDLEGSFSYKQYGNDVLPLVKDKALCPQGIENVPNELALAKLPREQKNYLLDVFCKKELVDIRDLYDRTKWNKEMFGKRVEDKAEAKKKNGRQFMEATTEMRLLFSEYEDNVAKYAQKLTGCVSGIGPDEYVKIMNKITEPVPLAAQIAGKPLIISFDIDKWSPKMPIWVHQQMDALFSDAFGMPHIADLWRVHAEGDMHYVKHSVHHTYDSPGHDFEGWSGRKLTIYHVAVMGYTVRRLRELGITKHPAHFASLIDDGALRVILPEENYSQHVQEVMTVVDEVYRMAGLNISYDKTFISSSFCVFLNDIWYLNSKVTPGLRAFLKITNRPDDPVPALTDWRDMIEGTCRGAIKAGTADFPIAVLRAFLMLDTFARWGCSLLGSKAALMSFVPVALGGVGASNDLALGGTFAGDPLSEGLGNLDLIVYHEPSYAPTVNALISQKIEPGTIYQRAKAPNSVRRVGPVLRTARLRDTVSRELPQKIKFAGNYISKKNLQSFDAYLAGFSDPEKLSSKFLSRLYKTSFENLFDYLASKFLRYRTALHIVGYRKMRRVRYANERDAREVFHSWL